MRQVLIWLGPVPVYGFGAMLFITFVACYWLAGRRSEKAGIARQYVQDLAIWIFVGGIIGARIVFMIQYGVPITQFYRVWEGGLVFYGSALGGLAGYLLGYVFIIRKHQLDTLTIADVVAPCVALGLSLGRIGCLLNGCCYGHVACPDCLAVQFPLSAPARFTLVQAGLQTTAGFASVNPLEDPRSLVTNVEPGSAAEAAGLRAGDTIVAVEGKPNDIKFLEAWPTPQQLKELTRLIGEPDRSLGVDEKAGTVGALWTFMDPDRFHQAVEATRKLSIKSIDVYDRLWYELVSDWPRGKTDLQLTVRHENGAEETLAGFTPHTLGLHPTQFYETVSTFLLFLVLLAYEPLKRRKGELMGILMLGYSVHRFINESLRNDTATYGLLRGVGVPPLTLSQWGSILVFVAGVVFLLWLEVRRLPEEPTKAPTPEPAPTPA